MMFFIILRFFLIFCQYFDFNIKLISYYLLKDFIIFIKEI